MWACEAAQASISPWTSQKRLHFLNSLQGPGCLAKSGLCLPGLAGFWLSKKRFGWLLAASGWLSGWTSPCLEKYRTYLAETGWTSPLPGGTIPRVGLRSSPGVDLALDVPKGCTSLTPCKAQAALPNQASACLVWPASGYQKKVWLASGWLLAGFLVGHPPAWKNLVLTWLKLAGPQLGAALCRHCPSHKRSKVDGTIPRVGLRSSPGVDLALDVPKKAALP